MENYYEYLELDMSASHDDIRAALEKRVSDEGANLQKVREIRSILLNESARRLYDEKLVAQIINGNTRTGINTAAVGHFLTLDNTQLHDKYIWLAISLFLLSIAADFIFSLNVNLVINVLVMLLTLMVFFLDWKLLKAHGKADFSKVWILVSPVYLFKRCKAVGAGKKLFLVWMVLIVVYALVKTLFNGGTALLEQAACKTVTDIYHTQLKQYSTSCRNVMITESRGKTHFGFAELSDGSTRDIIVSESQNGEMYVTLE
ncbi:hypothetical protein [Serratia oryzae]|uniref:J domain-containing protein n=1 Tax=Serratia oryzae TaxID=2034155 RepID=A0A1S8CD91_9GAMM|nr:hypothetical protein [Serratia oryzae]OMQ18924.1 hypothetical protein BMI79_21665 [Serratia oryzae]